VDDFETVKSSPWEGVRNYEARNLMKEMKVGEKVSIEVFYFKKSHITADLDPVLSFKL
jgi:predicted RNA-binding protein with PUA-like domain